MASKSYQRGDQPVVGYTLNEFLGRGGFGEVWKATGPGGVEVAMKIIQDLDRRRGGKELRALRLLKNIRHPNLVPLLGFWLKDRSGEPLGDEDGTAESGAGANSSTYLSVGGTAQCVAEPEVAVAVEPAELVIAMGLCETSLFDRFSDCRREGLEGIPADELMNYMEDAAKSVDFLNGKHEIQHCDIKPQNILLISGAAQVADFGLAKMIGEVRQSSTVAGTIAYGAPELLLGRGPTGFTDQYSLAISYFELRTGSLPFSSERISDVLRAKQCGELDLTLLPVGEQAVIARAAAVEPEERFASCMEMVRALRGTEPGQLASTNRSANRPSAALVNTACDAGNTVSTERQRAHPPDSNFANTPQPVRRAPIRFWASAGIALTAGIIATAYLSGVRSERVHESAEIELLQSELQAASRSSADQEPEATDESFAPNGAVSHSKDADARSGMPTSDDGIQVVNPEATAANDRHVFDRSIERSSPLDAVRNQFLQLAAADEIISDAREPAQLYHNARVFEQRGDSRRARESYGRFLGFKLDVVDAHLRYQQLLKLEQGIDSARLVYRNLCDSDSDLATRFASILLEPDNTRISLLREFAESHGEFAPAAYEMSLEFSAQRLGSQGLADKAEEQRWLERFEQQFEAGQLCRYYLDQTEASEQVEDARNRLLALRQLDPAVFRNPVSVSFTQSNGSWTAHVVIAEVARDVRYRLEDHGEFESTGLGDFVDQRTGTRAPKLNFDLPQNADRAKLSLVYSDVRGRPQGPFEFEFDAAVERIRLSKGVVDDFPNNWVTFGDHEGKSVAYFTHLLNHRYAIEELRYSVNSDALDQKFPLPQDPPGQAPGTVRNGDNTYIALPDTNCYVAVQLKYRDQTTSKVHQFQSKREIRQ